VPHEKGGREPIAPLKVALGLANAPTAQKAKQSRGIVSDAGADLSGTPPAIQAQGRARRRLRPCVM
jgi:hypothetical protein